MAECTPLVKAWIRYPDPSEPAPVIDLHLLQSVAADLRARLLERLEATDIKH